MSAWWYWGPGKGTYDRSRNAEKRGTDSERRAALIERMARRRRESWARERNRLDMKKAVLGGAQ